MHLEGMLDRDQRTAKIRLNFSDRQVPKTTKSLRDSIDNASSTQSSIISTSTKFLYLNWRKGYLIHSFQRLKNVLLVLVYLILVVTLPSSNSAPTNIRMSSRIRDEHPKWVNPCGLSNMDTTDSIPQLNTSDLKTYFEQILNIAGLAFQKADQLKVNFTRKTFNRDFDDLFKEQSYYWLPNLPKYEHKNYDNDQIKKTLLEAYENLQKVAVGVEQVVWDQQDRPGLFPDGFKELEDYLIAVLCELQMVISEMNINIPSDVPREHMPESQRFNLDVTASNVRDFIIMREALTTLEYIRDEFRDLAKAKKL